MPKISNFSPKTLNNIKNYQDMNRIYIAEIMDARTPLYNGDLMVWVLGSNTDKFNPNNWVIAHSSNIMNGLSVTSPESNKEDYNIQSTSFGWWNPLPYVGNYVFIFYPYGVGENSNPYWFGSPMLNTSMMIPGISYNVLSNNEDYTPICETNILSSNLSKPNPYPILKEALEKQGLDKDRLRGISTASTFRETPSKCYGFLSPLGNQFVIDDGWSNGDNNINWNIDPRTSLNDQNNKDDNGKYHSKKDWKSELKEEFVNDDTNRFQGGFRFRTRNGTQILVLDTGNIYMINKDGSAWMELSDDGYIDCYSATGVNVASDGDINLYSKSNINIEANGSINMKSNDGISFETSTNINAKCGSLNVSNTVNVPNVTSGSINTGLITAKNAQMSGCFQGTLQGTAFYASHSGSTPVQQPIPDVKEPYITPTIVSNKNNVEQQVDSELLETITTRVPTHEPYAGHDKNKYIPKMKPRNIKKEIQSNRTSQTIVKSNTI